MHLADEFYLIAHADTTGQPRLHPKAAGYSLAAALLGELLFSDNVTLDGQTVRVVSEAPPRDLLAHTVLEHLVREPESHPVSVWLAFLGRTAVEDVARRLTRRGVLEVVESRRLFGVSRSYVPVAVNEAAWPYARISARLTHRQEMDPHDQFLAGLAFATGLTREMVWDDPEEIVRLYLAQLIAGLRAPLRTLVTETEIAISKAAATRG